MSGYSRGRGRAYGRPLDREHPPPRRPYDRPTEAPGPSRQPVNSNFFSLASQLNHNISRFFSPEDTCRDGILFDDTSGLHLQEDAELSPGQVEIHFTSFRRSSDLILAAQEEEEILFGLASTVCGLFDLGVSTRTANQSKNR